MTLAPDQRNDLDRLLDSVVAANLLETQRERLNTLLRSGEEAQRIYLDYLGIHADLVLRAIAQPTADNLIGLLQQQVFLEEPVNVLPAFASTAKLDAQPDVSQSKPRVKPLTFSLRRTRAVLFSRSALAATLLVALLIYGAFTVIAWNLRPDKLPSVSTGISDFVAVVRDITDVRWSKNTSSKRTESTILPGEPLTIESGTIDLELKAGTKLVIEGPADWSVDGNNQVSLRTGKLIARVPKQAIGFTVETPTAKIVDLGTEFGVQADEHGTTEVQVFKGKIELHPGGKTGDSIPAQRPITLTAGKAFCVEAPGKDGNSIVHAVPSEPNRFDFTRPSGARRIVVRGALASSTYSSDVNVNNLINGRGLTGERHTNTARDATMWHTAAGDVRNQYVLFDLAVPCRLQSMKVWNYNDFYQDYLLRGVKQADIYVSNTNRGTPLDHPEGWKLVAEDVQFEPAAGTPDYDTPKIIPLNGVTARFVAIVIDDSLANGRPSEFSSEPVVGLSEVQFFGERSHQSSHKRP